LRAFLLENNLTLDNLDEVKKAVQIVLDRYNRRIHSSTKCRPYELHFSIVLFEIHPEIYWDTWEHTTVFNLENLGRIVDKEDHEKMIHTAGLHQSRRNAANYEQALKKTAY